MNSPQGKLIVISGIDGAGKTTLIGLIRKHLEEKGKRVVLTRQPSDFYRENPDVRRYLDSGAHELSIDTIAMLAATDRMLHIEKVINPSLEAGAIVICDRYVYSTHAYFKERGADMEFVSALNSKVPKPDAGILLLLPAAVSILRILMRDTGIKFEENDVEYMGRVQENLVSVFPADFLKINADQPVENIYRDALEYVDNV